MAGRAVQDAGLAGRGRRRHAGVPLDEAVRAAADPAAQRGQVAGRDRPPQQRRGQAVDLHDDDSRAVERAAAPAAVASDLSHDLAAERPVAAGVGQPADDRRDHRDAPGDPDGRAEAAGDHLWFDAQRNVDHQGLREQADQRDGDPTERDRQGDEHRPQHRAHQGENDHQAYQRAEAVDLDAGQELQGQAEREPARRDGPGDAQEAVRRRLHVAQHDAGEAQPSPQQPTDHGEAPPVPAPTFGPGGAGPRTSVGAVGTGVTHNHDQRRLERRSSSADSVRVRPRGAWPGRARRSALFSAWWAYATTDFWRSFLLFGACWRRSPAVRLLMAVPWVFWIISDGFRLAGREIVRV